MRKKKPYILPDKKPTCFMTPEIFNEIQEEMDQNERERTQEFINKYSKLAIGEDSDE